MEQVATLTGFESGITWDGSKPDGQPRRSVDRARAEREFGFRARTPFSDGLARTVHGYEPVGGAPLTGRSGTSCRPRWWTGPKQGFGVPIDRWFRGELRSLAHDVLLDARTRQRGYFHEPVVRRLLDEYRRVVQSWHYQLGNLLMFEMFELWHRTFVDGRPDPRPQLPTLAAHGDAIRARTS